jgi:hypothetical protein
MIRKIVLSGVLALALAVPASARTQTYFGFQIGIGNAPPPPRVVFVQEPQMVFIPETGVYVAAGNYDYDMFRFGASWYICDNGRWYRAPRSRGPYRVVDVRRVPRQVFYVPSHRWRHSYAGLPVRDRVAVRANQRDHGRGHGQGHGQGRPHDD